MPLFKYNLSCIMLRTWLLDMCTKKYSVIKRNGYRGRVTTVASTVVHAWQFCCSVLCSSLCADGVMPRVEHLGTLRCACDSVIF